MSHYVIAKEETVDRYFKGITIPVKAELSGIGDNNGFYYVPGWECRSCGWKVGTSGLPPMHVCSASGSGAGTDREGGE